MRTSLAHMPSGADAPVHSLHKNGIPVLYLDSEYGLVALQFGPTTPEATLAYLDTLIAEATTLRTKVQEANA